MSSTVTLPQKSNGHLDVEKLLPPHFCPQFRMYTLVPSLENTLQTGRSKAHGFAWSKSGEQPAAFCTEVSGFPLPIRLGANKVTVFALSEMTRIWFPVGL